MDKINKKKEMKIIKEIKSKAKIVEEGYEDGLKDNKESRNNIWLKHNNSEETSEMAKTQGFRRQSIVLETSTEEEPRSEIIKSTKERQEFDREEAVRERIYNIGQELGSRRNRIGRDSYESAYYAAGGGSQGIKNQASPEVNQIMGGEIRQEVARGRPILPRGEIERKEIGQRVGDERYQTQQGQHQKKRKYPWEV